MRILLLNWRDLANPDAGGAERYAHEVARRWVASGHEVMQLCAGFPGAPARAERDGVRILRAGSRWTVYREAARLMERTRATWDLVVETVNTRPFFAHEVMRGAPTLAVFHQLAREVWFHEMPLPAALLGRFVLEPRWLRRYRRAPVVALSESTRRDLVSIGMRPLGTVPPGTPTPPFAGRQKEPVPTLLFVGRLKRSKGPHVAIEVLRRVRRSLPEADLWVVGDGPLLGKLAPRAPYGVRFFGRVDEAAKWEMLARAHLLLVPSVREGWGIVVMEAARVGTPSVGNRVPGLVDTIRDGETGWLCDPRPDAMAEAVVRALGDPGLPALRDRTRAWARSFTWDETADRLLRYATTPVSVP